MKKFTMDDLRSLNPAAKQWMIIDWAGNEMFQGKTWPSFEDAEEYLAGKLANYDEDRQEYEIIKNRSIKEFSRMKIKIPMEIVPYLKSASDLVRPKSIRSYATFVKVFCEGESITIVSTDSYRLKEFKLKFSGMDFGTTEFNLSKAEIASIAKGKSDFEFCEDLQQVEFSKTVLALSYSRCRFPSYKAVIPTIASAPIATLNHVYLGGFFPAAKDSLPQARMYKEQDSILFTADFMHGTGLYLLCSIKD